MVTGPQKGPRNQPKGRWRPSLVPLHCCCADAWPPGVNSSHPLNRRRLKVLRLIAISSDKCIVSDAALVYDRYIMMHLEMIDTS